MSKDNIPIKAAAELHRQAEKKQTQGAEARRGKTEEAPRDLVQELQIHQIELEMQNEELRRAQEELDLQRTRYFDLYDLAPVGYITLSEQRLIMEANLTAAAMLGVTRNALAKQAIIRFIIKEDQGIYSRHCRQLLETGEPQTCELQMMKINGTTFWVRMTASTVQDAKGASECRVIIDDISERKQAEEELRQSAQAARRLAQENELIAEVGRIIGSTLNIEEVYERFSVKVKEVLPFDRIAVNTINRKDYTRTIAYVSGDRFAGHRIGEVHPLAGTGLEQAMRTKSSLLVNGKDRAEKSGKFPGMTSWGLGAQSTLLIPLISADEVFGALVLHSVARDAYSENDLRLAERVGSQIAGAVANAQLYQKRKQAEAALQESEQAARRLAQESETIAEIGRIVGSSLNIEDVYERFAEAVYTLIPIDRITINIINPQDNTATTAYVSGTELAIRRLGNVRPLAFTLTAEVRRTRAGLLVNEENYQDCAKKFPGLVHSLQAGFLSLMAVPLIAKDEVIGVLQFRSTVQNTYSEKELKLAERVGAQIAGAIANAQLFLERNRAEEQLLQTFERLRKAVNTTIQVLVSAVETRDAYTAGHQLKSADLARTIATEMGLPPDKIDAIRMAASIHDIGKLSIPAEILSKPTKLTELEFALIKEHSRRGFEMLKDVESPWPLAEIVYQHHERMDGSGYPRNLQGEEILIEARVLAVADVVEAMASHRPYRPALGIDVALNEIEKNKGIFYDLTVADACLKLFREKGFEFAKAS